MAQSLRTISVGGVRPVHAHRGKPEKIVARLPKWHVLAPSDSSTTEAWASGRGTDHLISPPQRLVWRRMVIQGAAEEEVLRILSHFYVGFSRYVFQIYRLRSPLPTTPNCLRRTVSSDRPWGGRRYSTDQAGLSTLPHSRQQISWRGVIRLQKGHIRCEAKSPARGVTPDIFLSQACMKTPGLRRRASFG
jgi:hypothetical protein